MDGQTCRISKEDTPGESDEEVDDATRHESDNLILVYILGNTMGITPNEQCLGKPITQFNKIIDPSTPQSHLLLLVTL